ncbi:uncharacterized protein LOC114643576 [Erpetoichthys calabaricus]|uniref:uncharacterized protein LOC114643576 n=1 Tax=Erpetoichthys calabaricus TaxID=27687 RepID=UPI0010A00581|nr:uncharacterized protein LOC114643576 [Erpetoichthys calabaricus]
MIFSIPERVAIVELYVETRSFKKTRTSFAERYTNSPVPSKRTIQNLVKRWKETGSVADKQRVRQRTVRTPQLVAIIQERMTNNPETSTRRLSQQVGASRRSCQRVLQDLRSQCLSLGQGSSEVLCSSEGIYEVQLHKEKMQPMNQSFKCEVGSPETVLIYKEEEDSIDPDVKFNVAEQRMVLIKEEQEEEDCKWESVPLT